MQSALYANAVRLSVRPVRPSVRHTVDQSETVEARITQFHSRPSPIPLVFSLPH